MVVAVVAELLVVAQLLVLVWWLQSSSGSGADIRSPTLPLPVLASDGQFIFAACDAVTSGPGATSGSLSLLTSQ